MSEVKKSKYGTKNGGVPMTAEEKCDVWGAEHIADWLIEHHGAKPESRQTIVSNIQSAYYSERARGIH